MSRLAVLELLLLLAIAAAVSLWWASRKVGLDESGAYWRAVPLSRLKYLIAAQCFAGASLAFFFDLLSGGTGGRGEVVLLAVMPRYPPLCSCCRTRGTPRVARGVTVGVAVIALILFRVAVPASGSFSSGPASTLGIRFDGAAMLLMMAFGVQAYRTHISTEGARQLRAEAELALALVCNACSCRPSSFAIHESRSAADRFPATKSEATSSAMVSRRPRMPLTSSSASIG
jgi:hypothetical protein